MEMESEKVRDLMPMVNINISATNEHVDEVESEYKPSKKDAEES